MFVNARKPYLDEAVLTEVASAAVDVLDTHTPLCCRVDWCLECAGCRFTNDGDGSPSVDVSRYCDNSIGRAAAVVVVVVVVVVTKVGVVGCQVGWAI